MNADKHRFLKSGGARPSRSRSLIGAVCLLSGLWLQISATHAAIFTNNARVEIAENNKGLTWSTINNALTISCWFKIAIPSGTTLTDNMVILVNRRGGTESDPRAYLIQFNIYNGNIEFSTRGSSGAYTNTLIERPYQDRWYHVAVVRQGEIFTGYVDGRQVFNSGTSVGDAGNNDGASIGGWSSGKYLFGEVQEFAVYQAAFGQSFILDNMFQDQRNNSQLTAYYKLGYSTNTADNLKNFAPTGPTGPGTIAGGATLQFEETDQAGEQSAFDSRRNGGRDAVSPLSGSFSWQQTALARPTPGIAFDFRLGYGSANAFGGFKLGSTDPFNAGPLGPGWRHTFETRLLPAQAFDPSGGFNVLGLMSWDGAIETWDLDVNTEQYNTRNNEYRGELTQLSLTQFQWVTPDRMIYIFRNPNLNPQVMNGRLLEIRDFNTNSVKINWDQTIGVITQVVDSTRGTYSFRYNPQNLLTNVSFGSWSAIFSYDPTNRLISKALTNTSGAYTSVNTTWRFDYGTNGLLAGVIDPRNFTNIFAQYDQYGRKTNEVDALNRATATRYGVPGKRQITRIDPGTNSWIETYDRKGHILAQQDPLTNITSYTYDTNGNRITITEPLGWTTAFGYDTRANVIAKTNALSEGNVHLLVEISWSGSQDFCLVGGT